MANIEDESDDPGVAVILVVAKSWIMTGINLTQAIMFTGLRENRLRYYFKKYTTDVVNLTVI